MNIISRLFLYVLAVSLASAKSARAQAATPLKESQLNDAVAAAIDFALNRAIGPAASFSRPAEVVLDTTGSFPSLRASRVATTVGLSRGALPVTIARSHRSALLNCPRGVLNADCRFVRPVTIISIGQTKWTSAGDISMLVHVNWPSKAQGNAGQFAGYSVEVVISKDQAGRWRNTKATTFIAG